MEDYILYSALLVAGWRCWSVGPTLLNKISLKKTLWIACLEFSVHLCAPKEINLADFGDPVAFPLGSSLDLWSPLEVHIDTRLLDSHEFCWAIISIYHLRSRDLSSSATFRLKCHLCKIKIKITWWTLLILVTPIPLYSFSASGQNILFLTSESIGLRSTLRTHSQGLLWTCRTVCTWTFKNHICCRTSLVKMRLDK